MNKNQLLQSCKNSLATKRANAQNIAYTNVVTARNNLQFKEIEKEERNLIFEIGKLKAFGKNADKEVDTLKKVKIQKNEILKTLNLTEQDLFPKYSCTKCNDLGYVSGVMCSCLHSMLTKSLIKECGAGKESLNDFKNFNADITKSPEHKEVLLKLKTKFESIAESFPNSSPKIIYLSGKTGVGKTFITECLAKALIDKGFLVSFISAFGMNNIFLSYHTTFDEQKQSYISALIDPDVLVIDDLGTEPILKNVTTEYLYVVLSERSRLNKLTVVTTNLEPSAILTRYNERIFSRLLNKRESFSAQIIGSDLRLSSNKKQ